MVNLTIEGVVWSAAWFFVLCLGYTMSRRRWIEWRDTPGVPPEGYSAAKGEFVMWASVTLAALVGVIVGLIHTFLDTQSIETARQPAEVAVLIGLCLLPYVILAGVGYNSYEYANRRRRRVREKENGQ